ncbi:MAG: PD40 domain-containing protein [Propionibacteriales bacterium]|nr:PD40 domain-containing protein [Propionibacteriales bacterium]
MLSAVLGVGVLAPWTALGPAAAKLTPADSPTAGIGGDIAFQSARAGKGCCRIFTMQANGTDVRSPLPTVSPSYDPAWSPDGSKLAFASFAHRNNFEIYVAEARPGAPGPRLSILTHDKSRDSSPAWSPDGQRLAFVSDRAGSYDVWRMDSNGDNEVDLSGNAANDCGCFEPFFVFAQPAYSPDGSKIASTSDLADPGNNLDVFTMDADGSHVQRLTSNAAVDAEADWSRDGREIAFASGRDGDLEIFVMNADGSGPASLTRNGATDTQPDWSPDGARFAFTSDRDGNPEIYVMRSDGSRQHNITHNPAIDERPDWRPTGG